MEHKREWLSLEEAADLLKVGVPTIQSLIDRGLLHPRQLEGQTVLSIDMVLGFLREDQRKLLEPEGQPPNQGLSAGGKE